MSKIVDFSSVYEEACVAKRVDAIKKELKKEKISSKKLHHLQEELYHLSFSLANQLKHQSMLTQLAMHQFLIAQAELGALLFDCKNIFIDKKVDSLTIHARKIAKASLNPYVNLSRKISRLNQSISSLTGQEALSFENRQMINLAKKYLQDAQARCYQEESTKDTKTIRLDFRKANASRDFLDPYDMSLALYEISGDLYQGRLQEGVSGIHSLAPSIQQELKEILRERGLNLQMLNSQDSLENQHNLIYAIIQVLIGYSNQLLYQSFSSPSHQEIEELFQGLQASLQEDFEQNEFSANF